MRTGQGDDSATLSVCHFLESGRRAPLRDRAKACVSDTLNADYVTLYTAPPEVQREQVIYFVDIMNVGFVFRVEQNTDVFAYSSTQGPEKWAFILAVQKAWD